MGHALPPLYGKSDFYKKKKEEALKKIAELQVIVEECDKEIAKESEEKDEE